jgi:hypothetical protein
MRDSVYIPEIGTVVRRTAATASRRDESRREERGGEA